MIPSRVRVGLLVLVFGLCAAAAQAQLPALSADPASPLPLDPAVHAGVLPSGFRYIIRRNGWPEHRAELRLVVNAGSLQEDDDQRGLAHVVEHMAFNGTRRFPKQALVDYVERIGMQFGAHLNASTSFDETVYTLEVPTDTIAILDTAFQILRDWAQEIQFDPAEVARERGVVIEEWRQGLGAETRMFDQQLPVLLQGSRYATRLPIGDRHTLETFAPEALRRFYRDWYRPDLMSVVAVGDFDPDTVEAMLVAQFGDLRSPEAFRPLVTAEAPPHRDPLAAIATDSEATASLVTVYEKHAPAPARTMADARRGFLDALADGVLNDRLDALARQADPPYIGAAVGQGELVRGVGAELFGATVANGEILSGLEALLQEAERLRRHGVTAAELARQKVALLRDQERAYDERDRTPSAEMAEQAVQFLLTDDAMPGTAYWFVLAKALIPPITVEEVNARIAERRTGENQVVLVSAPARAEAAVPDAADLRAVFDRVRRSDLAAYVDSATAGPLVDVLPVPGRITAETRDTVLETTTWTLSNGIRVILRPTDFQADEVGVTAYSPGGASMAVTPGEYLNLSLAPTLVGLGGAGRFNAVMLQKRLTGIAVNVAPFVGLTQEGIRGAASTKDLTALFQLIYLTTTAPRADTAAFTGFLKNVEASLANRAASPDAAFQDTVQALLADHHPWAVPLTPERVRLLDLGVAYHGFQDRFRDMGDFTFIFVGRFALDSIRPLVEQYLASLPATGRRERWKDPGLHPVPGVVHRIVRKGIEPQAATEIIFTGPMTYARPDRDDLRWLARVLEIRLRERLREALGGTYDVSVSATPSRQPREEYAFSLAFGSDPARVEELVAAVFAEIDTLQAAGAREEDLAKIREADIRAHETNQKRNTYWLAQLAHADQTGEAPAMLDDIRRHVAGLTSERMRAAARHYLDRTRYIQVSLVPER